MTTTTTTDPAVLVADYVDAWLETDPTARTSKIAAVFTPDGRHVDPHADARGHEGLAAMMAGVHEQFPGFTMRQVSAVDQHNDQLRFAWELLGADGSVVVAGIDAAEIAPDGRLARVTGFWGALTPA